MINSEEFEAFCNSQDKEMEEERIRQSNFISELESSLINFRTSIFI